MMQDCAEYGLIVAVLHQGIDDATSPITATHSRKDRDDAMRWVDGDIKCRLSFDFCCDVMGLDSDVVRVKVRRAPAHLHRHLKKTKRMRVIEPSGGWKRGA